MPCAIPTAMKTASAPATAGIERAAVLPHLAVFGGLIHDLGGDGILVSDADTNVDIHNNFIFNANNGIRLAVDLATGARVNLFNNTIYNSTSRGIASRNGGGSLVRQTTHQVTLRNNIVHTSGTVDIDVARPFDEAYFCTTVDGSQNPTTCGADIAPALGDETTNQTLAFTGVNTACLYVGSSQMFRGVGVSVVSPPSGSGANLQWDYWNGSSWASLETGTFADYNFSWDGFAYWADDPSGWVTRTVGGGGALYYARVCRSGSDSSPTEKLISRADVSLPSRYNLTTDKTGFYTPADLLEEHPHDEAVP